MLNYNTILSNYDDKLTLMQWLNKVEQALKHASATSFSVVKKGNATISFKIDFEDGTSLESGEIILQQGESVQSAAIVDGHLILTLSNGDELDAGNLGAVSGFSIDASQHLIVTYQDGTTNDLGAIFNGNVNISGVLTASSISTPSITTSAASVSFSKPIGVTGDITASGDASIGGDVVATGSVKGAPEVSQEITTFYSDPSGTIPWTTLVSSFAKVQMNAHLISVVTFFSFPTSSDSEYTFRFSIPQSIGTKIVEAVGNIIEIANVKLRVYKGGAYSYVDAERLSFVKAWNGALMIQLLIPNEAKNADSVLFRYSFMGIE